MTVRQLIRVLIAFAIVGSGVGAIIAGVALIYWPAALIVGGLIIVAFGALLIDIPESAHPPFPRREPGEIVE